MILIDNIEFINNHCMKKIKIPILVPKNQWRAVMRLFTNTNGFLGKTITFIESLYHVLVFLFLYIFYYLYLDLKQMCILYLVH